LGGHLGVDEAGNRHLVQSSLGRGLAAVAQMLDRDVVDVGADAVQAGILRTRRGRQAAVLATVTMPLGRPK